MKDIRGSAAPLLVALLLGACAPQPGGAPSGGELSQSAASRPSRTLNIVMRVEPPDILEGAVDRSAVHKPLFTAALGAWDLQEAPYAILAVAVPQLNTDTWRVFADGRMETVYRLRPNLTWHDGTPLTAEDFAFARRLQVVRVDSGLSRPSAAFRQMEEVLAPDAQTVVIRWRRPYTEAPAPEFLPFPRHILEPVVNQGELEALGNHPYWSTEWVGAGPYRIEQWERGAFILGVAFEGYALGRPKIHRVRLTWGDDPNANVARLLAGDVDVALDGSILFQQAAILKEQWESQTGGTILLNPTSLRYIQVQHRPDYLNPRALSDLRVRRAVLQTIDRPTLAEAILKDKTMVAHTVPPPTAAHYLLIDQAIAKYPYEPRQSERLMAEAGFRKGADGFYADAAGGRFSFEVRGVARGQEEQDTTIVVDDLRQAGLDVFMTLLPASQRAVDNRVKGTFPALTLNNNTLQRGLGLEKWVSSNIGSPETDWVGTNRSGWSNPDFDRLHDLWTTALDRDAANRYLVQMMKLLSEVLPSLPLYYNFQVVTHTAALRGPQPITPDSTRYGNIHEWEWK